MQNRFTEIFQPTFYWGVGILELTLVVYTLYLEFVSGHGPSLLTTVLPFSVIILIAWAVLAALITLAIVGVERRIKRSKH